MIFEYQDLKATRFTSGSSGGADPTLTNPVDVWRIALFSRFRITCWYGHSANNSSWAFISVWFTKQLHFVFLTLHYTWSVHMSWDEI